MPKLYTIGFTGKNAEQFFSLLKNSGATALIDVRLNNVSQLAAFSKKDDLRYFLDAILGWDYSHRPEWAPTEDILRNYKNKSIDWNEYAVLYNRLLDERNILANIKEADIAGKVLLCSEHSPKYCHRRLLAEYFRKGYPDMEIVHLGV
jgi:uncharacterized protein (DUF488 family)